MVSSFMADVAADVQAGLADLEGSFHELRGRLEFAELGVGQRFEHQPPSLNFSGQNTSAKRASDNQTGTQDARRKPN